MSDDLELDDFNLDDDLDLDLDLGFDDAPPAVTQGREAVIETATIAGESAALKVIGKGKERDLIKKALPKEYGEALQSYDSLATVGTDLVDQARKEVAETSKAIKRSARQAAPMIKKYLPEKIGNKLDKILEDTSNEDGKWDSEKEDPNEMAIASAMEGMQAIQTAQIKREEAQETEGKIKDQVDSVRGDNANKMLGVIADNTAKHFEYTNTVSNAYQRKMLELNFRQFFAQRDLLQLSQTHYEKLGLDIAAIVKNTALPDYAKEQFGEVTRALMQRDTIQRLLPSQFTGAYFSEMGKNASQKLAEVFQGIRETTTELGDGLEMMGSMDDTDGYTEEEIAAKQRQDAARMAGGMLAERYINPHRDKLLGKLRQKGEENTAVSNFGHRLAYEMGGMAETFNTIAEGDDTGTIFDSIRGVIEAAAPRLNNQLSVDSDTRETLESPSKFDRRTYLTINEVIPGLLTSIDGGIRGLNGDDSPPRIYDYQANRFVEAASTDGIIRDTIAPEAEKEARRKYIDETVDKLDVDKTMTEEQRLELSKYIEDRAKNVKRFDLNQILDDGMVLSSGLTEQLESSFGDKESRDKLNYEVSSRIRTVRNTYTEKQSRLDDLIARYGKPALEEAGIIKPTERGGYEFNDALVDTFNTYENVVGRKVADIAGAASEQRRMEEEEEEERLEVDAEGRPTVSDRPANAPRSSQLGITEGRVPRITRDRTEPQEFTQERTESRRPQETRLLPPSNAGPADINVSSSSFAEEGESVGRERLADILADIHEQYHSDDARQRALQPLIDAVNEGLQESNSKPELAAILTILEDIATNGLPGEGPEGKKLSTLRQHLSHRFGKALKWGKNFSTKAFGGIRRLKTGMGNAYRKVLEKAQATRESAKNIGKNLANSVKRVWNGADIYDKEGNVFLSGKLLKNGGYFNADGEPIKKLKDIKGAIYDSAGNVVIDADTVRDNINDLTYNVGGRLERIVGGALGGVADAAEWVKGKAVSVATNIKDAVVDKRRAWNADDVYVPGEDSPRLKADLMAKGFYQTRDGNTVWTVKDIDGEVLDRDGNVIISMEEMGNPEFQLMDKNGKPYRGMMQRVKDGLESTARLAASTVKKGVVGTWEMGKKGLGRIYDAFTGGRSIFNTGEAEETEGEKKTVSWLEKIYKLLDKRLEGGDATRDEINEEYDKDIATAVREAADGMVATAEGMASAASELKDKAVEKAQEGRATAENKLEEVKAKAETKYDEVKSQAETKVNDVKAEAKERYEDAREKAEEKYDSLKERAESSIDRLREEGREQLDKVTGRAEDEIEKLKEKLREAKSGPEHDTNGDGFRDGSWRSQFAERNADKDKEGNDKETSKDKGEKKGGFGALLSKLSGWLMPLGSMILSGLSTLKTGLLKGLGTLLGKLGIGKAIAGLSKTIGGWVAGKLGIGAATTATTAATTAATTSAATTAATTATTAAKAGRMARMGATAARWGGTALKAGAWLARGVASMNPVGLGILAVTAVAYGAYRVATRTEYLDRVRYAMYGTDNYTHGGGNDVKKIAYLEDAMAKYLSFSGGFSNIRGIGSSELTTIAAGMDVDVQSPEPYQAWQLWFKERFLPTYLLWTSRAYQQFPSLDMRKVSESDDHKGQLAVLKGTDLPPEHPLYSVVNTPFEDTIDAEDLFELRADMLEKLTELAEKQKDKDTSTNPQPNGSRDESTSDFAAAARAGRNLAAAGQEPTAAGQPADASVGNKVMTLTRGGETIFVERDTGALNTRKANNLNIMESIRVRSYGLVEVPRNKVENLFTLEDYSVQFCNPTSKTISFDVNMHEVYNEHCVTFGLEPENEQHKSNFLRWYQNRFLPVLGRLYESTNRLMPGRDPLNLLVTSSEQALPEVAKSMITAKDAQGNPVWTHTQSPWRNDAPLGSSTDEVMRRLEALTKLTASKEVNEEKLGNEVENREVQFIREEIRAPRQTQSASALADRYLAQGQSNVQISADIPSQENATDYANGVATPNIDATVFEGEGDATTYQQLRNFNFGSSREEIAKLLQEVSKHTGMDATTLGTIGMIESSLRPNAAAPTSSAKGLYQFINATWKEQLAKHGPKYGIPATASPYDPVASALLGAEYLKESQKVAQTALTAEPTVTDVYMGHFLGHGGARKFFRNMQRNPSAIAAADFRAAAVANPSIFANRGRALSYQEVYRNFARKASTNASHLARYMGGPTSVETMLAHNDVPNVDAQPGQREQIVAARTQQNAQVAVDREMVGMAPGTVDSSEVVAQTAAVLQNEQDEVEAERVTQQRTRQAARRTTERTIARTQQQTERVNVAAMEMSKQDSDIFAQQLKVQTESRNELAAINKLLGEYVAFRTGNQSEAKPSAPVAPMEVVHGPGPVSTGRQRIS